MIDYDCSPDDYDASPCNRLDTLERLELVSDDATQQDMVELVDSIESHITYLRALLGERSPLKEYVRATQGSDIGRWRPDYLSERRDIALEWLQGIGIGWHKDTRQELDNLGDSICMKDAPIAIREQAETLQPVVRRITGTTADFHLEIEMVKVDAYWTYWVDGVRDRARLRLNRRNAATFTPVRIRQFALHEILGHALQCASFYATCLRGPVKWLRKLCVFGKHQILLEGLAQALPIFVAPDDKALLAHVHLDHYLQLVRAELHVAINEGASAAECAVRARNLVPFWNSEDIADALAERSVDPLLRSYLWSYPAGFDWFVALAEDAPPPTQSAVLHACYEAPQTPAQLDALWPGRTRRRSPQ
ncbi:MAG: hypothetical protein ACRDSZ_21155 [Pseudonocardiaceae bacterium]